MTMQSGSGRSDAIAIIGMACLFPGAPNLDAYWNNILSKVDAVSDPPPEAWDTEIYYAPGSSDTDRVYCKRGGYLGALAAFDPLPHGIPPITVGGEPDQWLAFQLARAALADAGSSDLPEHIRHRTAVVLGKGTYLNGGNAVAVEHGLIIGQTLALLKRLHPEYTDEQLALLRQEMKKALPPITPETVPGLIPNITVGRIANRLDLMGPTYTVDAACASSLVAMQIAMRDLVGGECDLALVGGSQVWVPVPTLNVFCQLGALSRTQQIRPFDKNADGTLLGEGIGMVVLKRLADARRDGDRVYAAIRGIGVASDGRGMAVMAPRVEGEELALRRAYEAANVTPDTVELIEAHGTGTPVGDVVEVQALTRVFGTRESGLPRVALGSVKSMISHTMPAAGVAGVIKTALALYHKVLPPTLHCDEPNPKLGLERSQFYLNTNVRPWIHAADTPRRAGVNSFGFGGINAHVVLEEVPEQTLTPASDMPMLGTGRLPRHAPARVSEVCILDGASREELLGRVEQLAFFVDGALAEGATPISLEDLAYSLSRDLRPANGALRLAVVATSTADLRDKLARAAKKLAEPACKQIKDVSGIYFASAPLGRDGKVAFLFPGEGSQYANMLVDLCLHFPDARAAFDRADRLLAQHRRGYAPSDYIFARPAFAPAEAAWADERLTSRDEAVAAVLTANQAVLAVLSGLRVQPDVVVGHSTGDYSALAAAGVLDLAGDRELADFTHALVTDANETAAAAQVARVLLAIGAGREQVEAIVREAGGDLFVAMDNCPHQSVLVGATADADRALEIVKREGLIYEYLPFDRAYHTPLFAPYTAHLRRVYAQMPIHRPRVPIYSCTTIGPLPEEPEAVRAVMVDHWVKPVEFSRTVEALYGDGVRIFVEVGARGNLSAFVEDILRGRPFCAAPADVQRRSSVTQLNHLVGLLAAHGVEVDVGYLFRGRDSRVVDWTAAPPATKRSPNTRMSLSTGWPMLRLSEDVADRVRGMGSSTPLTPSTPVAPPSAPLGAATAALEAPSVPGLRAPLAAAPAHALASYFETMETFLSVQEDVVRTYLAPPRADCDAYLPLLGEVVAWTPGELLVARRRYDLDEDAYLADHTLGRGVSRSNPELRALAMMPLGMSLEILAEAALGLVPDLKIVGLRTIRARRWLAWDECARTLEVSARRLPDDEHGSAQVAVQLRDLGADDGEEPESTVSPVVSATVVLAADYEAAPARVSVDGRPSHWDAERVYAEAMFHGPCWQAVTRVERTGPRGSVAHLRVLPWTNFLRTNPDARFALDPVVLDAAGQVIGLWTKDHLAERQVIFPFALDALDIFGAQRPTGEEVRCSANIQLLGDHQVRSDIEVVDANGGLWMRLVGWWDKRFAVPDQFYPLILSPGQAEISIAWPDVDEELSRHGALEFRRVDPLFESDRAFWQRVWAGCVLGRSEREQFRHLDGQQDRRIEWLAGRTAAKEAVRALLWRCYGLDVLPADVEIAEDVLGQPYAFGAWLPAVAQAPQVAIALSHGHALALAGLGTWGPLQLGIDLAHREVSAAAAADLGFNAAEEALFGSLPAAALSEWVLRSWCAKNAISRGLGNDRHAARVVAIDPAHGRVAVRVAAGPGPLHPQLLVQDMVAYTHCDGDLIVASTVCEQVGDVAAVGT